MHVEYMTRRGFSLRRSLYDMPHAAIVFGVKLSVTTSAQRTRRSATSRPSGFSTSRPIPSFDAL